MQSDVTPASPASQPRAHKLEKDSSPTQPLAFSHRTTPFSQINLCKWCPLELCSKKALSPAQPSVQLPTAPTPFPVLVWSFLRNPKPLACLAWACCSKANQGL